MAVGVPENDVFAAADAVLARGERPTVERVRLELGRGSPARVGALLDQWWEQLAARLSGQTRMPGMPIEVTQAFTAVWQQATAFACDAAEAALEAQREVLAQEQQRFVEEQEQTRIQLAMYRQQTTDAVQAQQTTETRLKDLELLLDQRLSLIEELQNQREAITAERDEAKVQIQQIQAAAEQARAAQEAYVRGLEERAHQEIDRAREETKAIATKHKEALRQIEHLQRKLEDQQKDVQQALQLAAAQQARADKLEAEISKQKTDAPKRVITRKRPMATKARADLNSLK